MEVVFLVFLKPHAAGSSINSLNHAHPPQIVSIGSTNVPFQNLKVQIQKLTSQKYNAELTSCKIDSE
jgi:hypothetical protein